MTPTELLAYFRQKGAYCPTDSTHGYRLLPSHRLWHRQQYDQAGHQELQFFNGARSRGRTNWPGTGMQLPKGHYYEIHSIHFRLTPGIELDTDDVAATEEVSQPAAPAAAATSIDAFATMQAVAKILRNGQWFAKIGDTKYQDNYGLDCAPWGGGPDVVAHAAIDNHTTAAAASYYHAAFAVVNNGVPVASNVFRLSRPLVIPPQTDFEFKIEYEKAIALGATGNGGVIEAALMGDLYKLPTSD